MAKTQNQADETAEKNEIVEKEQVVINENDIVSGEDLKENDVIDVNSPEVTIEKNTVRRHRTICRDKRRAVIIALL